jgi:hypothetical protein
MTYRFAVLLTKEEDFLRGALPGTKCHFARCRRFESARGNFREAIELYLETWGAPKALESL